MPQGSPKKIEVDLLLADLALELGDLPPRRRALIRRVLPRTALAPLSASLRGRPVRRSASGPPSWYLLVPFVQPPAVGPDRPATVLTASPPATRLTAARFCSSVNCRCFFIQFLSTRNCPHFPVSLLGAATQSLGNSGLFAPAAKRRKPAEIGGNSLQRLCSRNCRQSLLSLSAVLLSHPSGAVHCRGTSGVAEIAGNSPRGSRGKRRGPDPGKRRLK